MLRATIHANRYGLFVASCLLATVTAFGYTGLLGSYPAAAQGTAGRTFPETGHTVSGRFLEYWDAHGGLAQQGYPISEEMQEKSDIDGKVYTVQYFERAVFEKHPENQPPNDVLLSLLGVLLYKRNYQGEPPAQQANTSPGSVMFDATGHRAGGKFLAYWQSHGGLAQQGYPITDEFQEKSPLDGKMYTVQYFERAVFELHAENAGTPYEVLLSQLGTFAYRDKYLQPTPTPTSTSAAEPTESAPPTSTPAAVPSPTAPPPPAMDCSGIPANVNAGVEPNCITPGDQEITVTVQASGFTPGEQVALLTEDPCCQPSVIDPYPRRVDNQGGFRLRYLISSHDTDYGLVKTTITGKQSGRVAVAYFKVIPPH